MAQTILTPLEKTTQFLTPDLSSLRLTAEQFEQICRDNPDLRLELTSTGGLIVMPPAGSKTGKRNFNLTKQLGVWVATDGTGIGFDLQYRIHFA
jgi:Uma2 family endonuclease